MARGSGGRKRRPRQHARPRTDQQLTPLAGAADAAPADPVVQSVEPAATEKPRVEKPRAEKPRAQKPPASSASAPARRSESGLEDMLFFTRLRKRAKWIFLVLALAFGIGFVAFGIGTGGGGVGDYIRDLLGGGGSDQPSIDAAREKIAESPDDLEARLELAQAYVAARQTENARATYQEYLERNPDDLDALKSLSGLYAGEVARKQQELQLLQYEAQTSFDSPFSDFDPEQTEFERALETDQLSSALYQVQSAELQQRQTELEALASRSLPVYQRIAELEPDVPLNFQQLAAAAQAAGQDQVAIDAYLRLLELDPEGPAAEAIEAQIRALGGTVPGDEAAAGVTDTTGLTETGAGATIPDETSGE